MTYRTIDIVKADRPEHIDAGPAPMLQWLKIEALVVDDSYQRSLQTQNWKAIRRIAAGFRWSMFSPVFVAPVEGGRYAIIDGQHRTHAAAICGFSEVPCQIVQMNSEEQAAAFAAVNGVVTKVTPGQIFKASLSSGESWAVELNAVAQEAGCELMLHNASHWTKKPGQIFGLKNFRDLVNTRSRAGIIAALRFLRRCEGWRDDAAYWDSTMLIPIVAALSQRATLLSDKAFQSAFEEFDIFDLLDQDKDDRKRRIARGLKYEAKSVTLPKAVLEWVDSQFPQRNAAE